MKPHILLLGVLLLWATTGCSQSDETPVAQSQLFAMDTFVSLTLYGDGGEEGLTAAATQLSALDSSLDRTQSDSTVTAINTAAGSQSVVIDADLFDLFTLSQTISQATNGAYDPTVAPIMDAWGWTGTEYSLPSQETLDSLFPLVGYDDLILEEGATSILLETAGMSIDLGGIGKGYAVQEVSATLTQMGITSGLIDMGSTITAIGTKPDGSSFNIAVKDPQEPTSYLCVLSLSDATTSTSGAYERYFEEDGTIYHHIIDPQTGYPANSDLLSVTVVSQNAPLTDALSTACFVLGLEESLTLWRSGVLDDFELILISQDAVYVTAGLAEDVSLYREEVAYDYVVVEG